MLEAAATCNRAIAPEIERMPVLGVLAELFQRQGAPVSQGAPLSQSTTAGVARSESQPSVSASPITWVEPSENMWLLAIKNFGLTLATFGVYHFWGRAETQRQIVNAVRINGRTLDYTATGREAFVSFLIGGVIAAVVVTVLLMMLNQAGGPESGIEGLRAIRWQRLMISLPLLFLLGSTVYRRRKHILRRTWLDGQRFDLSGRPWSYAWQHFWSAFLVPLTLGWAAPWRASRLEQRKIGEMVYGDQTFRPASDLKRLYRSFALIWFGGLTLYVGTLFVLGISIGQELTAAASGRTLAPLANWSVATRGLTIALAGLLPLMLLAADYRRAWLEHQVSSIATADGKLSLVLPRLAFLRLSVENLAMKLMTFGCLQPVAEARYTKFVVQHIHVHGAFGLDHRQSYVR